MIEPRLFLCSGAKIASDDPLVIDRRVVALNSIGKRANVNIRFENVARDSLNKYISDPEM